MVSALSPMQLGQSPQVDLVGSYLSGRQGGQAVKMNDQAIKQNDQNINRADYEKAVNGLTVVNKLAVKARSIANPQEREAFINSINGDMLKSVGVDPAQITQAPRDDQGLDALIAQTNASLEPHNQYRKESVSTNEGLKVFDPTTGTYQSAVGASGKPLTGAQYDPSLQGKIASARQTGQNNSDLALKPQIAAATETAKADVELSTRPEIERATTTAKAEAENAATKKQTQATASNKLEDAEVLYRDLAKADLSKIYGKGESIYPDWARSQDGINSLATRNQLVAMLKLGAAGELKGQGTITDPERQMIGEAATLMTNPDISPELAKESLDRAMSLLRRNAGKSEAGGQSTPKKLTYDPATGGFK